ncbi:MAG: 2-amino-4-hydroxy-6-hydroxymethyldihydropteridine diphosphokinase [Candidatus Omnitrophica bacterium]|nr:2-amino-4-hydroxy-6-hydroxymethyldihydropteridine diphosphokinase [Candidatus Omnitrophota bacterium]MCM8831521.1 2-amino-4-hydroxy-6-hydroxymethyldihydropteridine diphosphokinase [Candidatus Omnitrophota bacterium]
MVSVYIGVGSNLGDRLKNINDAIEELRKNKKIKVEKVSTIIETEPEGNLKQPKYLNAVLKIKTTLLPIQLLEVLQLIEAKLGRVRLEKNSPRTIDLDILLYGNKIIRKKNLEIPHPRMFKREFVLKPLLEIEPNIHKRFSKLMKNLKQTYDNCKKC